jgi:hypothetical protein
MRPAKLPRNIAIQIYGITLAIACALAIAPPSAFSQTTDPPQPRVKFRISAPRKTIFVNEPAHIELRVSNIGSVSTLIANRVSTAYSGTSDGAAHVQLTLTDSHGHKSPAMAMISDNFGITKPSDDQANSILLGSWALLYPGTSMVFDIPIGAYMFKFLSKPGSYKLTAAYSSKSVFTGGLDLGLSKNLLDALPYASWSGKISTNEIPLIVVSRNAKK